MIASSDPALSATRPHDATGERNMLLLIQLRWVAVMGQVATIVFASFVMDVPLPLAPMLAVAVGVVAFNLASHSWLARRRAITNAELLLALMVDVLSLTFELYLSGGATNPFVSLYLLQVVLGAILLDAWSSWLIVAVTLGCFALLAAFHRPLVLPPRFAEAYLSLYTIGSGICFALIAILLVLLVTRITRNLRARDARLADLRQRAAEEDHIVRIGLLASGAAHELGTPLASVAVILGDWRRMPGLRDDPALMAEIGEMQAEIGRCKAIVTGILQTAGEARGEAPEVMSAGRFLDETIGGWRSTHPAVEVDCAALAGSATAIVADPALKQIVWNILDNAAEASPRWIGIAAGERDGALVVTIRDRGPGFSAEMLAHLGKPYRSSKAEAGHGLGLFLTVSTMRKLGGAVAARNHPEGGAEVTLSFPLRTIGVGEEIAR